MLNAGYAALNNAINLLLKNGQSGVLLGLWQPLCKQWPTSNKACLMDSGPALGMFEVFGRTGPPILGGRQFWHPLFSVTYLQYSEYIERSSNWESQTKYS